MTEPNANHLKIRIFADGAHVEGIRKAAADPRIQGFTTNPTLMRAAKVDDYKAFAQDVLKIVPDKPVSFEVFADDFPAMEKQARGFSPELGAFCDGLCFASIGVETWSLLCARRPVRVASYGRRLCLVAGDQPEFHDGRHQDRRKKDA